MLATLFMRPSVRDATMPVVGVTGVVLEREDAEIGENSRQQKEQSKIHDRSS